MILIIIIIIINMSTWRIQFTLKKTTTTTTIKYTRNIVHSLHFITAPCFIPIT